VLGVTAIGNATLIVYDRTPVLVTDPWLEHPDGAYFGSWALEHSIPPDQERDALRAPSVWISHGHPDHLHPQTLERLRGRQILLPDHVGGRIHRDLEREGHEVSVLPDGEWVRISPRVRVLCIANYIQDAVLLVEVNGRLFVDLNDAASTRPNPRVGAKGCFDRVREIVGRYEHSYLLRLAGWGDADMIHVFDEEGRRIGLPDTTRRIGWDLSAYAEQLGASHVIPFSSFHRYQRRDSAWANEFRPGRTAYREGFREDRVRYHDPFCFVDAASGEVTPIETTAAGSELREPEAFGDSWHDELDDADWRLVESYFRRKELLRRDFRFLSFVVGGRERVLDLEPSRRAGIRFEVPRHSLMEAVRHEVFDNLLLGNYMKTTLYGTSSLYSPNFTYTVAKYADNGRAETAREVGRYLSEYSRRAGPALRTQLLERRLVDWTVRHLGEASWLPRVARRTYRALRG
jgi:hypothetical protein